MTKAQEKRIEKKQAEITKARKMGGSWDEPRMQKLLAEVNALCGVGQ